MPLKHQQPPLGYTQAGPGGRRPPGSTRSRSHGTNPRREVGQRRRRTRGRGGQQEALHATAQGHRSDQLAGPSLHLKVAHAPGVARLAPPAIAASENSKMHRSRDSVSVTERVGCSGAALGASPGMDSPLSPRSVSAPEALVPSPASEALVVEPLAAPAPGRAGPGPSSKHV